MIKRQYCFIVFLLCWLQASSQPGNLLFHHLNKEKGLPQSVCNKVFKDSRGFIWITTISGLYRYDGANFIDVTRNDPLMKSHALVDIVEDAAGNLWLSKYDNELVKYDRHTGKFSILKWKQNGGITAPPNVGTIHFLKCDAAGKLWFVLQGDLQALACLDTQSNISTIAWKGQLGDIFYWVANRDMLAPFTFFIGNANKRTISRATLTVGNSLQQEPVKYLPGPLPGYALPVDADNLWYVKDGVLSHYNWTLNSITSFPFPPIPRLRKLDNKLLVFDQHMLWIGHDQGLLAFDTRKKQFVQSFLSSTDDPHSVSHAPEPVFIDGNQNLWLVSWGKGIDYCNLEHFRLRHLLSRSTALRNGVNNFVRAINTDPAGNVYAAVENTGVVKIGRDGKISVVVKQEHGPFEAIMRDNQGMLWFGSKELLKYNPATDRVLYEKRADQMNIGQIASITQRSDGALIIGSYDNLYLFNPITKQLSGAGEIVGGNIFSLMYETPENELISCQRDQGISLYETWPGGYRLREKIHPSLFVKSILRLSKDTLLMATTTGFYYYHSRLHQLTEYKELNRLLPDQYLYAVMKDEKGYLWASSNNGLFRWKHTSSGIQFKSFGPAFGIQDPEFNTNAYCKSPSGELFFGGINGINAVDASLPDSFSTTQPNLQLMSTWADKRQNISPDSKGGYLPVTVSPGYSSIEIEYNAIDFFNAPKIQVRYRLVNYSDEWLTGNSVGTAKFLNVKPGLYRFEIAASDAEGSFNRNAQWMDIRFQPHWWQTWWFRTGVVIAAIILLAAIIRMIFNTRLAKQKQLLEKQLAIQQERERIVADLHDDIGATLSSMHIYGDLATAVWAIKPAESKKLVEKIAETSRQLMGRMGDIIWSMKPAAEDKYTLEARLKDYCSELLTPKNILTEFDIDEKIAASFVDPEVRKNILLIGKEAINNIAKYSEATRVSIILKQQEANIYFNIADNGKGYSSNEIRSGNGIGNIQSRVIQMKGKCTIVAGLGEGVRISCIFPMAIISH